MGQRIVGDGSKQIRTAIAFVHHRTAHISSQAKWTVGKLRYIFILWRVYQLRISFILYLNERVVSGPK